MTHDPLQPLTPEEGGLHGDIPDTPEARAWFQELGEKAQTATHDPCPNCAERPCECKPAPCCGVPWNPRDFASGKDCWGCQRSTQEMSA